MKDLFLYINTEDLNRFLIQNFIYPYNSDFTSERSLSLVRDNCLVLTTKKLSQSFISENCKNGFNNSVIVQLDVALDNANYTKIDDETILVNDIISCSCIRKIYHLEDIIHKFLYSDLYLFDSLKSEAPFDCGNEELNIDNILTYDFDAVSLDQKISLFSKIQAFYCLRFGNQNTEKRKQKNKLISKMNVEPFSFKYVCNETLEDFKNSYFGSDNIKKSKRNISLFDHDETTYINDNFENILVYLKNDNFNLNTDVYEDEENFFNLIYQHALHSDSYNFEDSLREDANFKHIMEEIDSLRALNEIGLGEVKKKVDENKNYQRLFLFILLEIINKDLEDSQKYIFNFTNFNSELCKELLSVYGLIKGMDFVDFTYKKNPSILVFAFKNTIKYFNNYVDMDLNYSLYYQDRDYLPSYIAKNGFDLKMFDMERELTFINDFYRKQLIQTFDLDEKIVAKKIVNIMKAEQVHELFLNIKRGIDNE